jgi:branched-chain amino acid transport system permease protein
VLQRRRTIVGAFLLLFIGLFGLAGTAPAMAEGSAIVGVITDPSGNPVPDVLIGVAAEGFTETGTTGPDGAFRIEIPKGGSYEVSIDVTTLPEGISLAKAEDESRTLLVLGGEKKIIIKLVDGEGTESAGPIDPETGEASVSATGGTGQQVIQLFFDGILFGILIALGALGLNLIFGTTGLTNFSHGELLTLGAFTAIVLNELGVHIIIAAPIAVIFSALIYGGGQNKLLWKPLRRRRTGLIASMIVTIGLAITLRYTLLLFFGGSPRSYQQYAGMTGISIGPFSTTPKALILAAIAVVVLAVTVFWLQNSRIGKATRAVSDNPALASTTGINVERVISVVWILGAGLAAFAGIYLGLTQDVTWNMGQRLLLVMFAAITLGGLGTIWGAIVGSLVVGVFIQMTTLFIPTEMKTVGALFLMIVILMVRPQGLLGRRERVG